MVETTGTRGLGTVAWNISYDQLLSGRAIELDERFFCSAAVPPAALTYLRVTGLSWRYGPEKKNIYIQSGHSTKITLYG